MIKILIVEDMVLLRDSLSNVINGQEDMRVVGSASDADEALGLCRELEPDLALIDVVTGDKSNGIAAAADIRRELPDIKVIIMTALPEITFIDSARNARVHSFVYKDSDSRHLLYVIRCTMNGRGFYPGPGEDNFTKTHFTNSEMAVIRLICQGKSRPEIASALSMSEGSIKALITGILNKSGFDSIMKFSVYAVAHGFIVPNSRHEG